VVSSAAQKTGPAITVGPTGCSENRNEVTTPKLPPPPRSAQNRSGCSSADARTMLPSAVTTSVGRHTGERTAMRHGQEGARWRSAADGSPERPRVRTPDGGAGVRLETYASGIDGQEQEGRE
jgi:hypothetical protein